MRKLNRRSARIRLGKEGLSYEVVEALVDQATEASNGIFDLDQIVKAFLGEGNEEQKEILFEIKDTIPQLQTTIDNVQELLGDLEDTYKGYRKGPELGEAEDIFETYVE